jgi:hypothetical protein
MTAHLFFVAELFGLFLRQHEREDRPGPHRRRFAERLARWRRQQAPPVALLSNHLRRDIGLEPVPRRHDWLWHR